MLASSSMTARDVAKGLNRSGATVACSALTGRCLVRLYKPKLLQLAPRVVTIRRPSSQRLTWPSSVPNKQPLKGSAGDATNAILGAVSYNFRRILAWFRALLSLILDALCRLFAIQQALNLAS